MRNINYHFTIERRKFTFVGVLGRKICNKYFITVYKKILQF